MTTHTPGPWTIHGRSISMGGYKLIPLNTEYPCALVPVNKRIATEVAANARLIAAAPDLLAALKSVAEYMGEDRGYEPILSEVLAAITKAEGVS